MNSIKYQTLGASKEVTGSCHLLELGGLKLLVDFGMVQDSSKSLEELYKINSKELPIDGSEIDYVILTHSHLDHIDLIARLPSMGFKGSVLCTALTSELINLNLRDAAYLHNKEIERMNKRRKNKLIPLYTSHSVDKILSTVRGYSFYQEVVLNDKVTVEFLPTGHLPGASMVLITYKDGFDTKRVLFTGDTSGKSRDIPFTMKPDLKDKKIHMIITESTYGDREIVKNNILDELERHVREICIDNKATLVIPAFSIGRSTNILYYLKKVYDKCGFNIPIFFASPMACKSHSIIGKGENFSFYDEKWRKERDLWKWDKVDFIDNFEDVQKKLSNGRPKICISSAGMLTGGYVTYIARNFLPHKKSRILLIGFQGFGTQGRRLIEGNQNTITLDGIQTRIRASVEFLRGMSSHADGNEIVEILSDVDKKKVQKIIITHGDYEQSLGLKKKLSKVFKDTEIIIPNYKQITKI